MDPSLSSQNAPFEIDTLLQPGQELDAEVIHASLLPLSDITALEACNRLLLSGQVDDSTLAGQIIELGQARGAPSLKKVEERTKVLAATGDEQLASIDWRAEATRDGLGRVLDEDEALRDVLRAYVELEDLKTRLRTFDALQPASARQADDAMDKPANEPDAMDLDDPWAEPEDNVDQAGPSSRPNQVDEPIIEDPWETNSASSHHSLPSVKGKERATSPAPDPDDETDLPFTLAEFLSRPLVDSATLLAEINEISHLQTLYSRHLQELWPWRLKILDALPPWANPLDQSDLFTLLRLEGAPPDLDDESLIDALLHSRPLTSPVASSANTEPLSLEELSAWYIDKVESLDIYGLIDIQLAWVQHGASRGLPNLDALGEDLSLLSRLAYDADLDPTQAREWNLQTWRASTETEIVRAYLSGSEPGNVVQHIRRLVLPYLYVLESRAERSGTADPQLVERSLHDALLELPLNLALPVFEASKATVSASERLIKNDLTVARLALACLYGSDQKDVWGIMSSIFECLPVWDITSTERDSASDKELTSTTLDSIASFVRPRKVGDPPPRPKDLFIFFTPLPFASLSRALDILDVHLESGEILSRWDTPVQLRFLLQSAGHHQDQMELAEKMVRRQSARGAQTDAKWTALWSDMLKLSGGEDSALRGAFGRLSAEEMLKIYLGGLLASGKFDIAKRMVRRLETEHGLDKPTLEEVALGTSREFYDNAETGNIHMGDMKLAYDCLSVPASSPAIIAQRDFIEATSRLSSFGIPSTSGSGTVTPLEIRYAKSKLDLIRRVLEASHDAFQHPELILDLADKLGYKGDVGARIQVLGMLVESAVKAGDYDAGYTHCQDMVALSKKRGKASASDGDSKSPSDVIWQSCLLVGSQSDYFSIDNRMTLLGQGIECCSAEEIPRILAVWRKVEDGQIKLDEAAKRRRLHGIRSANPSSQPGSSMASPAMAEERVLGSRTAARAARLAMDFAAPRLRSAGISPQLSSGLGFSGRSPTLTSPALSSTDGARRSTDSDRPSIGSILDNSGLAQGAAEAERVRQQARRALVRGVGWLLGADESEIDGGEQ